MEQMRIQRTGLPRPGLTLALLLGASVVVGWQTLLATFLLALRDDQYTHILLILPLSATLIFLDWPSLRGLISPAVGAGCVLMGIAVGSGVCTIWGLRFLRADELLSIRMLALVLFWIGACVLCLGSRVARALIFPLCFLFWLVPIPAVLLNVIINLLQQGSALSAHWLFTAFGIPVSQDGVILTIPGLTVEVAQECSSIRSSSMLLVTTMFLTQVLLRTIWRKALLVAIAVPLSVAKNGLRIFVIAMLGTRVDPGYLTGRLHHQGGIIFFGAALIIVFGLIWVLKRSEKLAIRIAVIVLAFMVSQGTVASAQAGLKSDANLQVASASQNSGTIQAAGQSSAKTPTSVPSTILVCPTDGLKTPMIPSTSTGNHTVILSWNASKTVVDPKKNAAGYCVFRREKPGIKSPISACDDCRIVTENAISGTGCVDDRVKDNTIYSYVVAYYVKPVSAQKGMLSGPSNEAKADTSKSQPVSSSKYPPCH